jgi:hypothetical protein
MPRSAAGSIALALALVVLAGCGEATKTGTARAATQARPTTKQSPTEGKTGCREVPNASGTGLVCTGPVNTPPSEKTAHTEPANPTPPPTTGQESPEERENRLRSAREALAHATSPAQASALHHEISKLVERR